MMKLLRIYKSLQGNLEPNSQDSDELELLSILVKEYEHEYYPITQ